MTRTVSAIIDELIALDPALKEHEAALEPLVKALLAADPAREPDADFLKDLRSRLQQRATVLSSSQASPRSSMSPFSFLAGAIAAVVIAVPAVTYIVTHDGMTQTTKDSLFAYEVTSASPHAFGDLQNAQPAAGGMGGARTGGGGMGGDSAAPMAAENASYGMADEKMMIYPPGEMTTYDFVYDGELPPLPQDTVNVLKRQQRFQNVPLSLIADRFDLGMVDLDAFGSAKLEYATFLQDKDFGHVISLGLRDGSISIAQNWEKWPQSKCQTEACWQAERVTIGQIPSDEEVIRIANDFIEDYGIDVSHYGEPFVENSWRTEYDRAADKSQTYVPETQRVIFPLLVEGLEVVEQQGEKSGISVGVHVKHKRVSDVWGLMDQTYASSAYDAVSDPQMIKDYLKNFEHFDPVAMGIRDAKVKNVRVTLGTPTMALSRHYTYGDAMPAELLVPSLVFPVLSVEGNASIYRKAVVIPLAKELFTQSQPPVMPLLEKPEPRPMDEPMPVDLPAPGIRAPDEDDPNIGNDAIRY